MTRLDRRLSAAEKMDARAALALLDGTGMSLEECARRAIVGRRAGKRITFADAVSAFLRDRMTSGARQATLDWYEAKLARFEKAWGPRMIDAISRAEIRELIDQQPVSASTRAALARALVALWHFCAAQEPPYVGADVTHGLRVTPPRGGRAGRLGFLDVATVEAIFAALPQYRNALAAQLFAGIRPEELAGHDKPRLLHRHVHAAERFIRIPDEIAKTGKARIIQNLPETFWLWYQPGAHPEHELCPVHSSQVRRRAIGALGRPLPFDAFRHTFITYAVALRNDAGPVSLWVGHEGRSALIFNTYLGLVTSAEAQRFFALRPPKPA